MNTAPEKMKLKRIHTVDSWTSKEKLCLASSVLRSGDQNWMSVSRSLRPFGDASRPPDWYSQKNCAVQYASLLENVETPKRKKRNDKGDTHVETPGEAIVKKLTQERLEELKRLMQEKRLEYMKLKEDMLHVKTGSVDDRLDDMCQQIDEDNQQKEKEIEAHGHWLKEREKKLEMERAWKPPPVVATLPHRRKVQRNVNRRNSSQSDPSSEVDSALDSPLSEPLNVDVINEENSESQVEPKPPSQTPMSPLLTSLLKSPSPAPTSQNSSILHTAITSHRGSSPTITSLLNSAPGIPVTTSSVTVAPPVTVSSSLKNLVSSAISGAGTEHPPTQTTSPAAGAPTLSMLLELPPSLPGKPLPELPSAAKPITTPPSTIANVSSATSETTCSTQQQQEGTHVTERDEPIEIVGLEISPTPIEQQKEEPIEVLIEEEVKARSVGSTMEEEKANTTEKETIQLENNSEVLLQEKEVKLEQPGSSTDVVSIKEITTLKKHNDGKEETAVQKHDEKHNELAEGNINEITAEASRNVEVVSSSETELTPGAVAEVVEIAAEEEHENSVQSAVMGPGMQELADMEVIILDKGQDHIDIKDIECNIVQMTADNQDKTVEQKHSVNDVEQKAKSEVGVSDQNNPETNETSVSVAVENKTIESVENDATVSSSSEKVKDEDLEMTTAIESVTESDDHNEADLCPQSTSEHESENNVISKGDSKKNMPDETSSDDVSKGVVPIETTSKDHKKEKENIYKISSRREKDIHKESVNKEIPTQKDTLSKEGVKRDASVKESLKKDRSRKDSNAKDSAKKETVSKDEFKRGTTREISRKDTPGKGVTSKKDYFSKELPKKDETSKERSKSDMPIQEDTKIDSPVKEMASKDDNVKEDSQGPLKASSKRDTPRDTSKKDVKLDGHRKDRKVDGRRKEVKIDGRRKDTKDESHKKETKDESYKKDSKDDSHKKDVKDDGHKKDMRNDSHKKEIKVDNEKDAKDESKRDTYQKQNVKDNLKDGSKKDIHRKDFATKDVTKEVQSKDIIRKDTSNQDIVKKDALVSDDTSRPNIPKDMGKKEGVKENGKKDGKRENKEEISKRENLKRNLPKEEKRDVMTREESKKLVSSREIAKKDIAKKGPESDSVIPDSTTKTDKPAKEGTESKMDDSMKDAKTEDMKKTDDEQCQNEELEVKKRIMEGGQSEADTTGNLCIMEEDHIRREGKEVPRSSEDIKQDVSKTLDEKTEKVPPVRAETPSTEDDKTNDAEPSRNVGRKRLGACTPSDSVPNSPAAITDEEREYRAWKKAIMLVYGRLATHKFASLFLRPITDDQAPGYSSIVHRPIDLLLIKKNIELGVTRTTAEFQRDVMLMFQNSIMYNKSSHFVHKMAFQMQEEGLQHIQDFLTTQMLVQVSGEVPIRRETRTTEANKQRDMLGTPGSISQDESDATATGKRKRGHVSDSERNYKKRKGED